VNFLTDAKAIESEIISTRRALHKRPELSYHEEATAKFVSERLRSMGIEVRRGVGGTGVVGTMIGAKKGRVVALRADMDALPVEEAAEVGFKSRERGVMHACGHDTHMAMLLGAAKILSNRKNELRGTVKFLFQPAEENGGRGGAMPMIEDGALQNPKVDSVFGLHIASAYRSGEIAVRQGALLASSDGFKVRIVGKGGHGARPHEAIDPIYVASQIIQAVQGVSGRMIDPVQPFVISICSIHSGTKDNTIPDEALLEGTLRALDESTRRFAKSKVTKLVAALCSASGAVGEVSFIDDAYPVTYNDPATTVAASRFLEELSGVKVKEATPVTWSEDFSRFLQKVPGTFYFLGTRNEAKGCIYPNHSSMFKVDEDVLKIGAASLALLAYRFCAPMSKR